MSYVRRNLDILNIIFLPLAIYEVPYNVRIEIIMLWLYVTETK
jgi:hypothetical protein